MNDTYFGKNCNECTIKEEDQQKRYFSPKELIVLEKCTTILFWMVIPALLGEILFLALIFRPYSPKLYVAAPVLWFVCSLAYGIVLLRMSSVERKYCVSGILNIVRAFLFAIAIVYILIETWYSIGIFVPYLCLCLILRYISYYFEFTGHSSVLRDMDHELSKDWANLKKWMIRSLVAIPCVLGLFWIRDYFKKVFPMYFYQGYAHSESLIIRIYVIVDYVLFPSLLVVLIAFIFGLAGVSILKYVYLSQTVTDFKRYRKDPIGFDPSKRRKDRQEEIIAANDFQNLMSGDDATEK